MSSTFGGVISLAFLMVFLQTASTALAQTQDLIVDICTTPNRYWNKQVFLKGHVVKVTPDPPGTNRGRFTLRDQSDKDIDITTDDLPAMGKVYTVNGVVLQGKPGDMVPVVRENSRVLAEPTPGSPDEPGAVKRATPPPAPVSAAPSGGKALSKKELEDAVRRELDQRDAQARQAQAPAAVAPPVAAPPPVTPGMWDNPWMILGAAVVVVAIVAVLIIALRSKPAPAAYAPPAAAAPPYVAPPASVPTAASAAMGQATQAARGVPTMAASAPTQALMQLGANLSITEGPDRGRNLSLGKAVTTIGRAGARKNDVELSDGTVSREQAKILYNQDDKTFTLVNEASTNPTRVNGNTVVSVALANNDKIEFGNTAIKFLRT
jgi:hypothetical protein